MSYRIDTEQTKRDSVYTNCTAKCKCGHSIVMTVQQDKTICKWCGKVVYNNSREYFKYKLKQALK